MITLRTEPARASGREASTQVQGVSLPRRSGGRGKQPGKHEGRYPSVTGSASLKMRVLLARAHVAFVGKVPFRDRFGLRYYLWKDTRLDAAITHGVRTDDTSVIDLAFFILEGLVNAGHAPVCVDAGAYIGVITLAMASKVRPPGQVFALEPSSKNYGRLRANLDLNGLECVRADRLALSDHEGVGMLAVGKDLGHCTLEPVSGSARVWQREQVPLDTLSSFALRRGIHHIDLLKVDTEGHDDKVLRGGEDLFRLRRVHFVICEYQAESEASVRSREFLHDMGYAIFYCVRNGRYLVSRLEDYPAPPHKPPLNLLAVAPGAPVFPAGEGLPVFQATKEVS